MFNRRKFIYRAGALAVSSQIIPLSLFAQSKSLEQTLDFVKKKFSGKSLTVLFPKGSVANVKVVADKFYLRTGVKIILKEAGLDSISSEFILDSKLKGRDQKIDIAIPATYSIPDLVENKAIRDLSSLAIKYEPVNFKEEWIYKQGDYYNGRLYGYQTDGDTYLTFYNQGIIDKNKSHFQDKFKKEYKTAETWSELDEQIKFFNGIDEVSGGLLPRNFDHAIYEFWSRLHSLGVYPVDDGFINRLSSDESVYALERLVELNNHLDPSTKNNDIFKNFQEFGKGDNFCNLGWGGTQKYLMGPKSKIVDKISHSLLPGGTYEGKTYQVPYFNWGWNYVVSSRSEQEELAYLFCLFATSQKISADAIKERDGYFDPFMESHYKDKRIIDIYGNDFLKIHYKSLKESIPSFYVNGHGLYTSVLKRGIELAINNHLTPRRTMNLIDNKWEKITDKIGREKQIKQWGFLKKSYPEKLQGILK